MWNLANNAAMTSLNDIYTLLPQVAGAAQEIEQTRGLPVDLVASLSEAGAFRALVPESYGGGGAYFPEYIRAMQALAGADASTAWCVNQAAVIGLTSLWLDEHSTREIWADNNSIVANGPPIDCKIEPVDHGYELNGHWGFSSGCQHATWMMGAAKCTTGGYRIGYFKPSDVTFTDNWQVAGLRGTGSFEFRIQDLTLEPEFVGNQALPARHRFDLTLIPTGLLFATSFAAVALGVADAALTDVLNLAQGKVPRYSSTAVHDDPDVQRFIGKAIARWRAADAYLHNTVQDVIEQVRTSGAITHDQRAKLRMAGTHVIQECGIVVDLAYKVAGSTGIFQDHTLQRRFQDMHVITQHVQARESYFGLLGRYALSGTYELGPMT